jgi:hypothetical protein
MKAKAAILEELSQKISNEVSVSIAEGQFTSDKEATTKAAKDAVSGVKGLINKSMKILQNELDSELEKRGVNPNPNTEADREKTELAKREVLNSSKMKQIVRSSAKSQMKGVRRMFVKETVKPGEQGEICVVALSSPKTMALADAIFSGNFSLAPKGRYGKPLKKLIPNTRTKEGKRKLLGTYGTEMQRDERGEFHLIAYAQAGVRSSTKTSINNALSIATQRAKGELRSFAQEYAMVNTASENSETAEELTNNMQNYEFNNALSKTLKSISMPIDISGITRFGRWKTKHPITNQIVVGVIMKWSARGAKRAQVRKREMNKTPARQRSAPTNRSVGDRKSLNTNKGFEGSASGGTSREDF